MSYGFMTIGKTYFNKYGARILALLWMVREVSPFSSRLGEVQLYDYTSAQLSTANSSLLCIPRVCKPTRKVQGTVRYTPGQGAAFRNNFFAGHLCDKKAGVHISPAWGSRRDTPGSRTLVSPKRYSTSP